MRLFVTSGIIKILDREVREVKKKKVTTKNTRESEIEKYLVREVQKIAVMDNGVAIQAKAFKWTCPGNTGVPDRTVRLPGGIEYLVEMKALGKKSTPKQVLQQRYLGALGFKVLVIDSFEGVDEFIGKCKQELRQKGLLRDGF